MPSPKNQDHLYAMRHSLAHIMATAIQELFPTAKFGVGPVVDNGFYYDVDVERTLTPDDLAEIEKKMAGVIKADYQFEHHTMVLVDALEYFQKNDQPFKVNLLEDLKNHGTTLAREINRDQLGVDPTKEVTTVSMYTDGPFTDLCRGPHVESTGQVGAFKLTKVSGAYWRGNEKNAQLQRIYGVGFETDKELRTYLHNLEEAEKRDHRKLGRELELFFHHETAPGMAYWLPKGVTLYNSLIDFWREEHTSRGYQEIVSPLLNKQELYQISGHYDHYWDDMFTSQTPDGGEYGMKPMNCPNAMIVYMFKRRSYKELPLRFSDTDMLHRYEPSGTLNGLFRARGFRQDDAHIFVTEDQVKEEIDRIFEIVERFYSIFGLEYSFRLSTRPEKAMGEKEIWDKAESALKQVLEMSKREYVVEEGDGAFYGPKIDIYMDDALGRQWQMGTIQLDFQQPRNFDLTYTDSDGQEKSPVAIHRVIYGSLERFIGILIEHTAGAFPVWLSPEQVRVVTVNDDKKVVSYASDVLSTLQKHNLRVELDLDNESVGKKIRSAELSKVPYTLVIGEKEVDSGNVTPRVRRDLAVADEQKPMKVDLFAQSVANEVKSRTTRASL